MSTEKGDLQSKGHEVVKVGEEDGHYDANTHTEIVAVDETKVALKLGGERERER